MAEVHAFIRQALSGRRLDAAQETIIEGQANELIGLAQELLEDEDMELVMHTVNLAMVKATISTMARQGYLGEAGVFGQEQFNEMLKVFAYELLTEITARFPQACTADLREAVSIYAYGNGK
jgi:hypothetical protein